MAALLALGPLGALSAPATGNAPAWRPAQRAHMLRSLDGIFRAEAFAGAGIVVLGADGTTLYARRQALGLIPASTIKLLIAVTALETLGSDYRVETRLVALDRPHAGAVAGPIWLIGGGDPLLTHDDLRGGMKAFTRAGVRRIDGDLIVDDTAFAGPETNPRWGPDDLHDGYAVATSAISLDRDTIEVRVAPAAPGKPARLTTEPPSARVALLGKIQTVAAGSPAGFTIERLGDRAPRNRLIAAGTVAAGHIRKDWIPLLGISAYVGDVALGMLKARRIAIRGRARVGRAPIAAVPLWVHQSKPLGELVRSMLVHSDNHSAEQLLRLVALRTSHRGTIGAGLRAERATLAALGIATGPAIKLADASGLSSDDRVSVSLLAALTAGALHASYGRTFLRALPVAGKEGTVRYRQLGAARGRVRAKSGHLFGVSGLVGTIASTHHGRLVFAFLVNDPRVDERAIESAEDRALDLLAQS